MSNSGCKKNDYDKPSEVKDTPANKEPHITLTSNKSILHRGETAIIIATFVNPTNRRLILPTESISKDVSNGIDHRLVVEWNEKSGKSSSPISALSLFSSPPTTNYLEPGQSKSVQLSWKYDELRNGTATLKYEFGWSDDFPPSDITFKTQ